MSEIDKYKGQKEKLSNLCDEHNLTYRLRHDQYPITLSVYPMQGMYAQLSMLEEAEDGKGRISQDASLTFFLQDGEYAHQIVGTFTISETLLGKFRNIFKKLCTYWMQYYFRATMEDGALKNGMMPVIDEDEAEDQEEPEEEADEIQEEGEAEEAEDAEDAGDNGTLFSEDLIDRATKLVRIENKCTTSLLQRRLKLGYSSAARLVDILEERGIIGPYKGADPRDVLPYDVPEDE